MRNQLEEKIYTFSIDSVFHIRSRALISIQLVSLGSALGSLSLFMTEWSVEASNINTANCIIDISEFDEFSITEIMSCLRFPFYP